MTDSTDNAQWPERIWLTNFVKEEYGARLGRGTVSDLDHGPNPDYPEYILADLAPDPLDDPRVMALVEAVRHEREMVCQDMGMQMAASAAVDAALAALSPTGGNADG